MQFFSVDFLQSKTLPVWVTTKAGWGGTLGTGEACWPRCKPHDTRSTIRRPAELGAKTWLAKELNRWPQEQGTKVTGGKVLNKWPQHTHGPTWIALLLTSAFNTGWWQGAGTTTEDHVTSIQLYISSWSALIMLSYAQTSKCAFNQIFVFWCLGYLENSEGTHHRF